MATQKEKEEKKRVDEKERKEETDTTDKRKERYCNLLYNIKEKWSEAREGKKKQEITLHYKNMY